MANVVKVTDLAEIATASIVNDTLLVHPAFNHAQVEYEVLKRFPDAKITIVSPGTDAYTIYGPGLTLVISTDGL